MSRWSELSAEGKRKRVEANQRWREKNPDKMREIGRRHYWKHVEKRRALARELHQRNREKPGFLRARADKAKEHRNQNLDVWLYRQIRSVYGLTKEQHQALVLAQQNRCAICNKPETHTLHGKVKRLAIDHDHTTGKVRGLLCHRCNLAVGLVNENPDTLRRMADWIESHVSSSLAASAGNL